MLWGLGEWLGVTSGDGKGCWAWSVLVLLFEGALFDRFEGGAFRCRFRDSCKGRRFYSLFLLVGKAFNEGRGRTSSGALCVFFRGFDGCFFSALDGFSFAFSHLELMARELGQKFVFGFSGKLGCAEQKARVDSRNLFGKCAR